MKSGKNIDIENIEVQRVLKEKSFEMHREYINCEIPRIRVLIYVYPHARVHLIGSTCMYMIRY